MIITKEYLQSKIPAYDWSNIKSWNSKNEGKVELINELIDFIEDKVDLPPDDVLASLAQGFRDNGLTLPKEEEIVSAYRWNDFVASPLGGGVIWLLLVGGVVSLIRIVLWCLE